MYCTFVRSLTALEFFQKDSTLRAGSPYFVLQLTKTKQEKNTQKKQKNLEMSWVSGTNGNTNNSHGKTCPKGNKEIQAWWITKKNTVIFFHSLFFLFVWGEIKKTNKQIEKEKNLFMKKVSNTSNALQKLAIGWSIRCYSHIIHPFQCLSTWVGTAVFSKDLM